MQGKKIPVKYANVLTLTFSRSISNGVKFNILYSMENREKLVGSASYLIEKGAEENVEEVKIQIYNNSDDTIILSPEDEEAFKEKVMQEGREIMKESRKNLS